MDLVINPGLSIVGISPVRSTMVDSIPIPTAPPSITASMRPSISSITWLANVGEGLPEELALGAAIYNPLSLISSKATGWEGIRIAIVSSPPVVPSGTIPTLGSMIVSGPGQKASIRSTAFSGTSLASV